MLNLSIHKYYLQKWNRLMFNLNYKLYCHNPNSVGRYTKYIAALHNNNNINERTISQNNKNINTNKPLNHDNINNH